MVRLVILGFLTLALVAEVAMAQESPFTITTEYQRLDSLTADQQVLLKDAVRAAYESLRKYVTPKAATSALLADPVDRDYEPIPSPPPNPSLPPLSPDLSAEEVEARHRRMLLGGGGGSRGRSSSSSGSSNVQVPRGEGEGERRWLQATGPRTKRYPDFAAADARLRMCGRGNISTAHVRKAPGSSLSMADKPGEFTDLYLYVTADTSGSICPPSNDIRAFTCLYDTATGRPVMSGINICPSALDNYDLTTLVSKVLKALITALGVERVGFYGLAARSLYSGYIVKQTDADGRELQFLATPAVTQAVRTHFGCDTAPGAMLENARYQEPELADSSVVLAGGERLREGDYVQRAAVVFVGWEFTHFQDDIMVASPEPVYGGTSPQVTQLSLALLSDTTWYGVRVNSQGYWAYGKGRGCDMATRHCSALLNATSAATASGDALLICNPATYGKQALCAAGSVAVGTCDSSVYTDDTQCGVVRSATPGLPTCLLRELELTSLSGGRLDAGASFGWGSGFTSRCVPVRWPWTSRPSAVLPATSFPATLPSPPLGASCFKSACSAAGDLSVEVLGSWVRCPSGATVNVTAALPAGTSLTAATLGPCPRNSEVCATTGCTPASCSPRGGECREGRCYCKAQYGGAACSVDLMSGVTEDLAGQTTAYSILEMSVVLNVPLSRFYARQAQFLKIITDSALSGFSANIAAQLAVSRIQNMGSFPAYKEAGGDPQHLQVVTRFLAANALQATLFERAFKDGLPTSELDKLGFTTVANSTLYLGQTVLRTMPPPAPPSPPSPPASPPAPPPSPPQAPPSSDDDGLTGDEKVAIGVGVAFGVLLLLLLFGGYRAFRRWQEVQDKIVNGDRMKEISRLEAAIEEEQAKQAKAAASQKQLNVASPQDVQLAERGVQPVVMVGTVTTRAADEIETADFLRKP